MTNRFACARKFASNIIKNNNLTPPIEPLEIIKNYGIEIIEEENQYGIEAYSDLKIFPKITLNTEFTYPARRKFTLAHELGHIIIPWHNGDVKCDTDKPYKIINGQRLLDTQELEANIFASELLMPHNWLIEQLKKHHGTFSSTINMIREIAQTSIMACLYALESALPSGHLYYVQKDFTDYWKKFASERTCSTDIYTDFDKKIAFLDKIAEKSEKFNISQYSIIYYSLLPCPSKVEIKDIYSKSSNIIDFLNKVSNDRPTKTVLFLKEILNSLDDVYSVIIFENDYLLKRISHKDSMFKAYGKDYSSIIRILNQGNLEYFCVEDDSLKLVFIREKTYNIPNVELLDPNILLRRIAHDLYPQEPMKMLRKINAIVSNINSLTKEDNIEVLYNRIKYRFVSDPAYKEFCDSAYFEQYIVNKVISMLNSKKRKHAK